MISCIGPSLEPEGNQIFLQKCSEDIKLRVKVHVQMSTEFPSPKQLVKVKQDIDIMGQTRIEGRRFYCY